MNRFIGKLTCEQSTHIPKQIFVFFYEICANLDYATFVQVQTNQAIRMLLAGVSVPLVSRTFDCSCQTIFGLTWSVSTTGRQNNHLRTTHLRRRLTPLTETTRRLRISAQKFRNRLREVYPPIRARRPYTGPVLTERHRAACLRQARHLKDICG